MPRFELRQDGTLDPLAPFKVLTVMCYPHDRVQREKMLGNIQKETGEGKPRRHPLTSDVFFAAVRRVDKRAAIAGGLLLSMIQLHSNGFRASLNQAIPLVDTLLPRRAQPQGPYWSKEWQVDHYPHSRRKMLMAFDSFRSVNHLWAALLHGQQYGRQDVWPGSPETLPTFLAFAEAILDLACRLPSFGDGQRFLMNRLEAWHFTIPHPQQITLTALPLSDEQLQILNEQGSHSALR
jgi:hypothetical protein